MTTVCIPYGRTHLEAVIPDGFQVEMIDTADTEPSLHPGEEVRSALAQPLGDFRWEAFTGAASVAIAVNDKTRPVPHDELLPPLIERLGAIGIKDEAVTFYVAVGTHPAMRPDEFPAILPQEVIRRFRVISHDPDDPASCKFLGKTRRGTPVWIRRDFCEAQLKIVIGNIEPHQFAGFSGGVKTAAIGLAAVQTINVNHAWMLHADAQLGAYAGNPVRQDIDEIGALIQIHLALNAVFNNQRRIVRVLAGGPGAVMRNGLDVARRICQTAVPHRYDLVISSPGGHPKDINMYQSQKALAHAAMITALGGTIILAAACPEGSGSRHYEDWVQGKSTHEEVLRAFAAEGFRIGPHKAYQIARDASKVRLLFVSDMNVALARHLLLDLQPDLQSAIDQALPGLPGGARIAILPHAVSTIPAIEGDQHDVH